MKTFYTAMDYDSMDRVTRLTYPDPLMDSGSMNSGGTEGTWNRVGRNPGNPPGPHPTLFAENADNAVLLQNKDLDSLLSLAGLKQLPEV